MYTPIPLFRPSPFLFDAQVMYNQSSRSMAVNLFLLLLTLWTHDSTSSSRNYRFFLLLKSRGGSSATVNQKQPAKLCSSNGELIKKQKERAIPELDKKQFWSCLAHTLKASKSLERRRKAAPESTRVRHEVMQVLVAFLSTKATVISSCLQHH